MFTLLQGRATLGDLAADTISVNSSNELMYYFDKLLSIIYRKDTKFKSELNSQRDTLSRRISDQNNLQIFQTIIDDLDKILKSVQTVFARRHVIVHDLRFSADRIAHKSWFTKPEIRNLLGEVMAILLLFETLFERKFVENSTWHDSIALADEDSHNKLSILSRVFLSSNFTVMRQLYLELDFLTPATKP